MSKNNVTRIRHEEYITDIIANATGIFVVGSFSINPGISSTFPWLSTVAGRYEKYRFRELYFEYRAKCSTITNGSVISMVDYDAADATPINKQIMLGSNAIDSNLWSDHIYQCNKENLIDAMDARYIRFSVQPPNTDIKTYDVGNYIIATQGSTTAVGGELFVCYDIELITPQLVNNAISQSGTFVLGDPGTSTPLTIFGNVPTIRNLFPGITVTLDNLNHNIMTFLQSGAYIMDFDFTGTGLSGNTLLRTYNNIVENGASAVFNAAATRLAATIILNVGAGGGLIDFNGNTGTTITQSVVRISPYLFSALG